MNSGKSTTLIQAAYNYQERGMVALILKPRFDNRDSDRAEVASRIGLKSNAYFIPEDLDELKALLDSHVKVKVPAAIFVDEVQFVSPDHLRVLTSLHATGFR